MGQNERLPERLDPTLEANFPNLRMMGYTVTSKHDQRYNCVAHAADDSTRKWALLPIPWPGYYWPSKAVKGDGIEALVSVFETLGYELCAGDHLEDGYQKVALYVDQQGYWSHAARQEEDGAWSSKLKGGL